MSERWVLLLTIRSLFSLMLFLSIIVAFFRLLLSRENLYYSFQQGYISLLILILLNQTFFFVSLTYVSTRITIQGVMLYYYANMMTLFITILLIERLLICCNPAKITII